MVGRTIPEIHWECCALEFDTDIVSREKGRAESRSLQMPGSGSFPLSHHLCRLSFRHHLQLLRQSNAAGKGAIFRRLPVKGGKHAIAAHADVLRRDLIINGQHPCVRRQLNAPLIGNLHLQILLRREREGDIFQRDKLIVVLIRKRNLFSIHQNTLNGIAWINIQQTRLFRTADVFHLIGRVSLCRALFRMNQQLQLRLMNDHRRFFRLLHAGIGRPSPCYIAGIQRDRRSMVQVRLAEIQASSAYQKTSRQQRQVELSPIASHGAQNTPAVVSNAQKGPHPEPAKEAQPQQTAVPRQPENRRIA